MTKLEKKVKEELEFGFEHMIKEPWELYLKGELNETVMKRSYKRYMMRCYKIKDAIITLANIHIIEHREYLRIIEYIEYMETHTINVCRELIK